MSSNKPQDSPAVKKSKLMQNTELHRKECHPHGKKPLDSVIEKFNKDKDIYKLTNKPTLTKAMDLLEVSIEKYKAVKANLKKTQNAWQASINENVELKHELDELKHLCSKSILSDLAYVLKRERENSHVYA